MSQEWFTSLFMKSSLVPIGTTIFSSLIERVTCNLFVSLLYFNEISIADVMQQEVGKMIG